MSYLACVWAVIIATVIIYGITKEPWMIVVSLALGGVGLLLKATIEDLTNKGQDHG